jgi:bacterioferritin-associated ferredoxin
MTKSLQSLIDEVASDTTQCFSCRSAAVGALITNIRENKLSPEEIQESTRKMSEDQLCAKVRDFKWPEATACECNGMPDQKLRRRVDNFRFYRFNNFIGLEVIHYNTSYAGSQY